MKKIKKVLLSLALVCVACVTAGLCIIKTTSAEEIAVNAATENVYMREGASVNVSQSGVRFGAYVNKAWYDALENKETGVYVIPADLLGENQLTDATENAVSAVATVAPIVEGDYYLYNYVLRNIPAEAYGRKLVARAYVKSGDTYTWANNAQSRSLAYVASVALQKASVGEATFDAAQTTTLKNYVDGAVKELNYGEYAHSMSPNSEESAGFVAIPQNAAYDLSDLAMIYTSDNTNVVSIEDGILSAKNSGYAHVKAFLGNKSTLIRVIVTEEKYEIFAQGTEKQTIPFSVPEGYTAEFYFNNDANWGPVDNIVIPDDVKNDISQHKLYNGWPLKISLKKGNTEEQYVRPNVLIATNTISTPEDWNNSVRTVAGTEKSGYYILTEDITISGGTSAGSGNGVSKGFSGVVDGKNHTVTINENSKDGIFGVLSGSDAKKALISNLTIIDNSGTAPAWGTGTILAKFISNTEFKNVTININKDKVTEGTLERGSLANESILQTNFDSVVINLKAKVTCLFGGPNASLGFGSETTFKNCHINLLSAEASLREIGHQGSTIYVAKGMSTEGTEIDGIQFNPYMTQEATVGQQDVSVVTAAAIDLGEYSDYTVTSITCEGEDLGQDAKNLVLSETIKKKQGNE